MPKNYVRDLIRRSRLIMPAHRKKFVEKAYARNADAIVLDLEDSVPDSEKTAARGTVKEGIALAGRGGSEVIVRINHTDELMVGDLHASVWPGLNAIYFPKTETAKQVVELDAILSSLEYERGLEPGGITINAVIETPLGYLNAESITASCERIDSVTLGMVDFCANISMVFDQDTKLAMLSARMHLLMVARAYDKVPMGLIDSFTGFSDVGGLEQVAALSYKHGFLGSSCIHPDNVAALNKHFSPSPEAVAEARTMMALLDEAYAEGKAAITYNGRMIDIANYKQAEALVMRADAIEAHETRKRKAREAVA